MRNCNAPPHYLTLSLTLSAAYLGIFAVCQSLRDSPGLSVSLYVRLSVCLSLTHSLSVGCVSICNVGINSMWMHVMFMSLVCCVCASVECVCVWRVECVVGYLCVCVWVGNGSTNGLIANCCRWKCQQEWHACKSSRSRRWRGSRCGSPRGIL